MKSMKTVGIYVLIALVMVGFFIPIYWMVSTSIKELVDVFAVPPKIFKFDLTWKNYTDYFGPGSPTSQLEQLGNSIIVALMNGLLATAIGAAIAYGSTVYDFKRKNSYLFWILSLRMLPPVAFAVPFFIFARTLYLLDTRFVLILMYCLFNVPLAVWLLRSFFSEIPKEIREAALADGATEYQIFFRLFLPLARSGIVVTFLFTVIFAWNEFLLALVLTSRNAKTMPVAITSFWSTMQINWGGFASTGTILFIPIMILSLVLGKQIVRGLTFGAVKE